MDALHDGAEAIAGGDHGDGFRAGPEENSLVYLPQQPRRQSFLPHLSPCAAAGHQFIAAPLALTFLKRSLLAKLQRSMPHGLEASGA
jgi:hypothetical protein